MVVLRLALHFEFFFSFLVFCRPWSGLLRRKVTIETIGSVRISLTGDSEDITCSSTKRGIQHCYEGVIIVKPARRCDNE